MEKNIGTHLELGKNETLYNLIENTNFKYFQIYLGPKVGAERRVLSKEDLEKSVKLMKKRGFFIHSSLTNYLSCEKKYKSYCKYKIINELRHINNFPISGVVIHPGTCNSGGNKRNTFDTMDVIVKNIFDLYSKPDGLGNLFIENSAGEGSKVPKTLDEISYMIKKIEEKKQVASKIKVCIDTCHLFAAGEYDISKKEEIFRFKKDFSKKVGLKYLKLIHLNDSKDFFGSRKDRHEILGKGKIWKLSTLSYFFELFPRVPYICETSDFNISLNFAKKAINYSKA